MPQYSDVMTETAGTDVISSDVVADEASDSSMQRDVVGEAVALIDRGLSDIKHRELLSASEVADLLLDVRLLLAIPHVDLTEALEGDGTAVALAGSNN